MKVLVAVLMVLMLGCSQERGKEVRKERVFSVKTEHPQITEVYLTYETFGYVEADEIVKVRSELSGQVEKILKDEGDKVKNGEMLATIEEEKYRKAYEEAIWTLKQAKEELLNAKGVFERRKKLFQKNLISREEFENAKTRYEALKSKVKSLERVVELRRIDLEKTKIRSPVSGVVKAKLVEVGEFITPQRDLFEILAKDSLKVVFKIPQEKRRNVRVGDKLEIIYESKRLKGNVVYISPFADRSGMITVKANVRSSDLLHGEFVKVHLFYRKTLAFKVPEEAVQISEREIFLWKVENGRAKKVPVKIVRHEYGYLYVQGDLKKEDRIIVKGFAYLFEGAKVKEET